MKRKQWGLLILVAVLGFSGDTPAASVIQIGTAAYGGNNFKLIFEGELNGPGLVWLDYARFDNSWDQHVAWASNLGFTTAEITLNPAYTTNIDWSTGWRLPSAGPSPQVGYNQTTSEWGHLYYVSLGCTQSNYIFWVDPPFDLQSLYNKNFWSGTPTDPFLSPGAAWFFSFLNTFEGGVTAGFQAYYGTPADLWGMAVHEGTVSVVPEPATYAALGGLAALGFAAYRRRKKAGCMARAAGRGS